MSEKRNPPGVKLTYWDPEDKAFWEGEGWKEAFLSLASRVARAGR